MKKVSKNKTKLFLLTIVTCCLFLQVSHAEINGSWAYKVDGNKLLNQIGVSDKFLSLLPFTPSEIHYFVDKKTQSVKVQIIAPETSRTMIKNNLSLVRSELPSVGCGDSINFDHTPLGGKGDRRENSNKSLSFNFLLHGEERACDFINKKYVSYSAPVKFKFQLEPNKKILKITPDVVINDVDLNWTSFGKVSREVYRLFDQITDIVGWDLGFDQMMRDINESLDASAYERNADGILRKFAQEVNLGNGQSEIIRLLLKNVNWGKRTGFVRHQHSQQACSVKTTSSYAAVFELDFGKNIGVLGMNLLSYFLRNTVEPLSVEKIKPQVAIDKVTNDGGFKAGRASPDLCGTMRRRGPGERPVHYIAN